MSKPKLQGAALILAIALKATDSALSRIMEAIASAMVEGHQTIGLHSKPSLANQKANLVRWAKDTAEVAGLAMAFNTLRTYIENCAAVCVVPDAIGVIKTGPKGKESVRNVTSAEVKTKRELQAVAAAANAVIGVKPRGLTGAKTPVAPMGANPKYDAAVTAEAAKGVCNSFAVSIRLALDGKQCHKAMFETLERTLKAEGWHLAMTTHEGTPEPSRGQKAAATRRKNEQIATLAAIVKRDEAEHALHQK